MLPVFLRYLDMLCFSHFKGGHQQASNLDHSSIFLSDPIFINFGRPPLWNCPTEKTTAGDGPPTSSTKKTPSSGSNISAQKEDNSSSNKLSNHSGGGGEETDMEGQPSIYAPNRSGDKRPPPHVTELS
jgi:hypothetical protein